MALVKSFDRGFVLNSDKVVVDADTLLQMLIGSGEVAFLLLLILTKVKTK